jgi:hypothetical protein
MLLTWALGSCIRLAKAGMLAASSADAIAGFMRETFTAIPFNEDA